jgi:hypothetical protein
VEVVQRNQRIGNSVIITVVLIMAARRTSTVLVEAGGEIRLEQYPINRDRLIGWNCSRLLILEHLYRTCGRQGVSVRSDDALMCRALSHPAQYRPRKGQPNS